MYYEMETDSKGKSQTIYFGHIDWLGSEYISTRLTWNHLNHLKSDRSEKWERGLSSAYVGPEDIWKKS